MSRGTESKEKASKCERSREKEGKEKFIGEREKKQH